MTIPKTAPEKCSTLMSMDTPNLSESREWEVQKGKTRSATVGTILFNMVRMLMVWALSSKKVARR